MKPSQIVTFDRKISDLQLDGYAQYAASSKDANLYYLTNFLADDPFLFVRSNERSLLVVSGMEKARAVKSSAVDRVYAREDLYKDLYETSLERATFSLIDSVLKECEIKQLGVNADFPIGLADELRVAGYVIHPISGSIESLRSVKSPLERRLIAQVQRVTEKALASALTILRHSKIRGNTLQYDGRVLTSERLKRAINWSLVSDGCNPKEVIAASGNDSALPHLTGSGPVNVNSSIVFDISPQSATSRYHADMSRTVLRGDPPAELSDMYAAVQEAQNLAINMLRPGMSGAEVHLAVADYFTERGFKTDTSNSQGFIHSTGHGLGLEVHELPFLSKRGGVLEKGNVVTVEPGLYYPHIGGVRLEDVAVITKNGNRTITKFAKEFVI